MDNEHTAPETPANKDRATKRVTYIGDYLASFSGHAARLRKRRVLTRSGRVIDADTLRRVPEITPRRGEDVRRAFYLVQEGGLVAVPAPTPPISDHKANFLRWLLVRLSESSTYRGIFLLLGALGWVVTPEHSEAFIVAAIAMSGAVAVAFADKPGEE